MKLVDMKITEFLEVLKSDAPAPGGGSVSALSGAQGCALFMMVADLTLGKEKYKDMEDICLNAKEKGKALYEELTAAVDKDTDAFNLISKAFKMPKNTDEEKAARKQAIADGTLVATEVPFRTMELGFQGLKLAESLVGHSNPNCASDLGVGILQLKACIYGAWLNVKINLPGVKDEAKAEAFTEAGLKMYEEAEVIAKKCFEDILASL
ncbi:MAG: cyclodeaminase/cyclohydrolase family protein [Hornefia sp.]|nr:cyclodeaminase/cyclohydrolase family protein [Hornefia sp.]